MGTDEKEISIEKLKKWCMALGIFLALMWICTIVSKSIYVAGLPRVTTQTPGKKYVEHIVETEGIVVAGGEFAVNTTSGIRVSTIYVQAGDLVAEGDLLFCVDLEDLEEIISEKERELKKLKYHLSDFQENQALTSKQKEKKILRAKEDYDSVDEETGKSVEEARRILEDAEEALEEHLDKKDSGEKDSEQTVSGSDAAVSEDSPQSSWQQTKESLEAAVNSARQNLEDAERTRENALQQKRRALADAEITGVTDSTAAVYRLDMEALQAELSKVYELRGAEGEVRAQKEGFVSKIQVVVGSRTSDTAAILLTDGEVPCQFKFSITKEQGKYLHLGDKVKLKIGSASNIDAEVDYLSESASGGYDMICRLPKDTGTPGANGSVRKTVQGEQHNTVIPIEALHKENEAYYIYVLKEKNGILGKELYAEKLKVQVADLNERYAALEAGTVAEDTEIITYSSEELEQGAGVRMME
ncbi:MAG: hypothetical protein NC126_11110 [Clostridium sp.]|nr:hypothetical protein [Clostridium sp.]